MDGYAVEVRTDPTERIGFRYEPGIIDGMAAVSARVMAHYDSYCLSAYSETAWEYPCTPIVALANVKISCTDVSS